MPFTNSEHVGADVLSRTVHSKLVRDHEVVGRRIFVVHEANRMALFAVPQILLEGNAVREIFVLLLVGLDEARGLSPGNGTNGLGSSSIVTEGFWPKCAG